MNDSLSYKGLVVATFTGDCWLSFQHQPPQLPFLSKEGPDLVHVPALTHIAMSLGAGDPTLFQEWSVWAEGNLLVQEWVSAKRCRIVCCFSGENLLTS